MVDYEISYHVIDEFFINLPFSDTRDLLFPREISIRSNCLGVHPDLETSIESAESATVSLI